MRRGLRWLLAQQQPDGFYGDASMGGRPHLLVEGGPRQGRLYNHACASMAVIEAYGMTHDAAYLESARRALDLIESRRWPYFGWGYGTLIGREARIGEEIDVSMNSSVTCWMMLPVCAARSIDVMSMRAGLAPRLGNRRASIAGGFAWLNKCTDHFKGRTGYARQGAHGGSRMADVKPMSSEFESSLSAVAALLRLLDGTDGWFEPTDSLELCTQTLPAWNRSRSEVDFLAWHFTAQAAVLLKGNTGKKWERELIKVLADGQRQDGEVCESLGSWDPVDAWSTEGGRVYATAINALTLLAPRRLPR